MTLSLGIIIMHVMQCMQASQEYHYRSKVVMPALRQLAVTIIMKSNEKNLKWLYVVPLYHFMAGLSSPYELVPLNKPILWKFWDQLESVRNKQQSRKFVMYTINLQVMCLCICFFMQLYGHSAKC